MPLFRQHWSGVGGAVYFDVRDALPVDSIIFDQCVFESNTGDDGGAVFYRGKDVLFTDCVFRDNVVRGALLLSCSSPMHCKMHF